MNKQNFYFEMNFSNFSCKSEILARAYDEFDCDGAEEFSLQEAEIDELLGTDAFLASDASSAVIEKIEQLMEEQEKSFKVFFSAEKKDSMMIFLDQVNTLADSDSKIEIFEKEVEDWNQLWRESFQIIDVCDGLKVVPSWLKKDWINHVGDDQLIYLYPSFGFGTGQHETTKLCLKNIFENSKQLVEGNSVLDLGCGSGILGILAVKLGAKSVDFCDVSIEALENTTENCLFNDLMNKNKIFLRSNFEEKKYQTIFANILLSVLVEEANFIKEHLNVDGYLILSGILQHQREEIFEHYGDLELIKEETLGDWKCLIFKKSYHHAINTLN